MGMTLEKAIAGAIVLIGVYLVVTNPSGTSTASNSLFGGADNTVKALQGR